MVSKNRYYRRSKISEAKFRQLVRCFALDFTAMSAAELTGLSVQSVNSIYLKMRGRIAESCELESPLQGAVNKWGQTPRSFVNFLNWGKPQELSMKVLNAENPNWPSKNPGNPSGPGRGNNPPGKK